MTEYADPFIETNFGASAVTVTTTFGFGDEEEEEEGYDAEFKKKGKQIQETAFQRIQRKSEGKIKPLKQLKREKKRARSKRDVMVDLAHKKKRGRAKVDKTRWKEQVKKAKKEFAAKKPPAGKK